jgi:hypothetical protein
MPRSSERVLILSRCYTKALRILRQRHDPEFQTILSEVYREEGVSVNRKRSHMGFKVESNDMKGNAHG